MGWLSTEYRYRAPVTVDCSGGGGAVGVVTSIPGDWDQFWSVILPSGIDVVVTGADGVTVLDYERSFNAAARTFTLTIGPVSLPETGAHVLWVYYGNPAETVDRAVSVSVSGPRAGHIEVWAPRSWRRYAPEPWGAVSPRENISIKPVEVIDVHVGGWPLAAYADGWAPGEELRAVSVSSMAGVEAVDILDASAVRIIAIDGEPIVTVRLREPPAGDYLLTVKATTTRGQTWDWRAAVSSRDVSAP